MPSLEDSSGDVSLDVSLEDLPKLSAVNKDGQPLVGVRSPIHMFHSTHLLFAVPYLQSSLQVKESSVHAGFLGMIMKGNYEDRVDKEKEGIVWIDGEDVATDGQK